MILNEINRPTFLICLIILNHTTFCNQFNKGIPLMKSKNNHYLCFILFMFLQCEQFKTQLSEYLLIEKRNKNNPQNVNYNEKKRNEKRCVRNFSFSTICFFLFHQSYLLTRQPIYPHSFPINVFNLVGVGMTVKLYFPLKGSSREIVVFL